MRSVVVAPRGRLTVSNADIQDADIVLEDRDGHAHNAYIPGQVCGVVAIRPDGMVGAIVQNEQWLHKYFMGIFSGEGWKITNLDVVIFLLYSSYIPNSLISQTTD